MSDDGIPELDLPPPPPPPPPRPSAGVRSAARAAPLPDEKKKKLSKEQLQEGAIDVLLNSLSILKEVAEDFRNSDRFFKYKAAVLFSWFLLSVTSVGVACPGGGSRGSNDIDAHLVITGDLSAPTYSVTNNSAGEWQDVEIIVNGNWRMTAAQMAPNDMLTLSPRMLIDPNGNPATSTLRITDIMVRTADGEAVLFEHGKPQ